MILGLGGKLSGGKTNNAVRMCKTLSKGRKKILANIQLNILGYDTEFISNIDFVDFIKHNFENQKALRDKFSNSILLLDELGNLISSRKSGSNLNELITTWFMMLGKLSCSLIFTYQSREGQIDKRLREIANIYGNCYRIDENGKPLIFEDRIVKRKIYIMVIYELDFDILGRKIIKEIYDPSPFYKMYDTREVTLLDRALYTKGGSRDLTKRNSGGY